MTKVAKNKEILETLYTLATKSASAPKPVATGVPGKEPDSGSVSDKHDTVDQNAVGPEKNKPQSYEQKPSTDPAAPTGGKKAEETPTTEETKTAEETPAADTASPSVEKLGQDILSLLQKFAENPVATGVPGKEPDSHSVSDKHDTVDQNAVKPETNPQGYGQRPAKDPSVPVATAKSAEEAEKIASYELGRAWADAMFKQAAEQQLEQIKEAGRRDFEMLVTQAAAKMKQASTKATGGVQKTASDDSAAMEKAAEAEGAAAFHQLYKQAQAEQALQALVAEHQALQQKLAAAEQEKQKLAQDMQQKLSEKQAALDKIAAEQREEEKIAAIIGAAEERFMRRLQAELQGSK